MKIIKCIKGKTFEELTFEKEEFEEGETYYLHDDYYIADYYGIKKRIETKEDILWLREHFVELSKEDIARTHYKGLVNGDFKLKKDRLNEVGEEEFVKNYPISCGEFVSRKRFWLACYQIGIVKREWYEEEKYNDFEKKLRDILDNFQDYDEPTDPNAKTYKDVEKLFKKYSI